MIIFVRLGVLVRWIVCTAVITTVIVVSAVRPVEPDPTSPTGRPTEISAAGDGS